MEVGLSLGSNMGDRLAHMRTARDEIKQWDGVRLIAQSRLYETEPVDVTEDIRHLEFLNAVLIVESDRSAGQWMENLHLLEFRMGRVRGADRNDPRPMDVDILYIDDECIDSGGIIVPHPRWAKRRFVVQPLSEVRPEMILPGAGKCVREILAGLSGEKVSVYLNDW